MSRILLVTPAPPKSRKGNRITAERWANLLRRLGHRVQVTDWYRGQPADLLVALHARKSAAAIRAFHRQFPTKPIILALTGTDLYRDLKHSAVARRSLELATRLVVLQPLAIQSLPVAHQKKARVVLQSATSPKKRRPPRSDVFEVCVVGHLRAVKDPFRAALAVRDLPVASTLKVIQIGGALTPAMENRARREMQQYPRYEWLGELSYEQTKQRMAQCRLLVLSSKLEGGANVISEAIAAQVPVIASAIDGSIGLLGRNYPGFFSPGNTAELQSLLLRTETDERFRTRLQDWCVRLRPQFMPEAEQAAWAELLAELA